MEKTSPSENTLLQKVENSLLDLLFPLQCIGCGTGGKMLCEDCLKKIPEKSLQQCPICEHAVTTGGEVCGLCKKRSEASITRLVVSSDYQDPLLAKAIHLFKYKFARELANPLGRIIERALTKNKIPIPNAIIPVPLHPRRLRWRGFNQAELLAEDLSKTLLPHLSIRVKNNVIARSRHTLSQMKVKNYQSRFKNISGAFNIKATIDSSELARKNILLVDDVCTTGATILECAKQLKKLRPRSITAVVLARQG